MRKKKPYRPLKLARKAARQIGKEGLTGKAGVKGAKRKKKAVKKQGKAAVKAARKNVRAARKHKRSIKRTTRKRGRKLLRQCSIKRKMKR